MYRITRNGIQSFNMNIRNQFYSIVSEVDFKPLIDIQIERHGKLEEIMSKRIYEHMEKFSTREEIKVRNDTLELVRDSFPEATMDGRVTKPGKYFKEIADFICHRIDSVSRNSLIAILDSADNINNDRLFDVINNWNNLDAKDVDEYRIYDVVLTAFKNKDRLIKEIGGIEPWWSRLTIFNMWLLTGCKEPKFDSQTNCISWEWGTRSCVLSFDELYVRHLVS